MSLSDNYGAALRAAANQTMTSNKATQGTRFLGKEAMLYVMSQEMGLCLLPLPPATGEQNHGAHISLNICT